MLHTGDFRWEVGCERARMAKQVLRAALGGEDGVDVLYLDNTYANPTYDFPSRQVAARKVIDLVKSLPDHDVIIGINSLGKEDLLVQIAMELNIKVCVWPERLRTMRILGLPDVFTTDTTITRVRAVPQCSLKIDTLETMNQRRPTIGILPSGLPWAKKYIQKGEFLSGSFLTSRYKRDKWSENSKDQSDKPIGNTGPPEQIHQHMYAVPYSEHSNYFEIEDFIKVVKPTSIKGIVSASECYIEPMHFFGRLCRVNQPKQDLHNRSEVKDSGKRVGTVSPETSLGDDVKLHRYGSGTSRIKLLGVRKRRLSVLIRKRRGVKIVDIDSPEIVGN